MIVFLFVVLFALCCFNANFRTTTNIMNVLRQASFVAIIAMGEFFVILIGEMDMSISSTIGMVSIFFAGFSVKNGITTWSSIHIGDFNVSFNWSCKRMSGSIRKNAIFYCNTCRNEYVKRH